MTTTLTQPPTKTGTMCWAHSHTPDDFRALGDELSTHWSRVFEYPWVLHQGKFRPEHWVLDAAGGDTSLQFKMAEAGCKVVNVDIDPSWESNIPKKSGVKFVHGDLKDIPFPDGFFDRTVCVSVMEHTDDPERILDELWRVTAPGGKMLVTLDVADYSRYNHVLDQERTVELLERFGCPRPPDPPDNVLRMVFNEVDPDPWEPRTVQLIVLCFCVDKI